jgi:hypothetical protein
MAKLTRPLTQRLLSLFQCSQTGARLQSVCEALWAAAEAPDTTISVTLTAATGAQFVFPILPEFPTAGGAGTDAQTVDFTFKVANGTVAETFS